jgi:hypothetical protein
MSSTTMSSPVLSTIASSLDYAAKKAVPGEKGLFRRLYDRMIEARMRQANDVLRQHSHLIPHELEQAGWKISARSEDSLPFVR